MANEKGPNIKKKQKCKNCEGKGLLKKGDKVVKCQRCGGRDSAEDASVALTLGQALVRNIQHHAAGLAMHGVAIVPLQAAGRAGKPDLVRGRAARGRD